MWRKRAKRPDPGEATMLVTAIEDIDGEGRS
jgi:hypothetical protein